MTPFTPTAEIPGSAEKVKLLIARETQNARDGEQRSLFIDGDAGYWENGTKQAPQWGAVPLTDGRPVYAGRTPYDLEIDDEDTSDPEWWKKELEAWRKRRANMPQERRTLCPNCRIPASRAGHDHRKRQRYECPCCHRTFTEATLQRAA